MKHYIIWKLKDSYTNEELDRIKSDAKRELEALNGKIDGLISLEIVTDLCESSSGDMVLLSEFTDYDSFIAYRTHPLHVAAADKYVRPFIADRVAADF